MAAAKRHGRILLGLALLLGVSTPILVQTLWSGSHPDADHAIGLHAGPVILPNGSIIANGKRASLGEARNGARFELFRPNNALADDKTLVNVWVSSDPEQVAFQYASGIRVYVHPSELGDPLAFYQGQNAIGRQGLIEQRGGLLYYIVAPDGQANEPGSVDVVIRGIEIAIVGDYSADQLGEVAQSLST